MKKIYLITLVIIFFVFNSCNLIIDVDTTNEISEVSIKPVVTLLGEPVISLPVGGTYTEEGIEAYVGDSLVDYVIVSGNVNVNQEGFYVVTYLAENQFGWATYAYRAVLVYQGSAYGNDIAGNYRVGFFFYSDISKHSVNGYWEMDNVWAEDGVDLPIIFADNGDNTYGIVPGEHPSKGRYSGTAVKTALGIDFVLTVISPDGILTDKTFEWISN